MKATVAIILWLQRPSRGGSRETDGSRSLCEGGQLPSRDAGDHAGVHPWVEAESGYCPTPRVTNDAHWMRLQHSSWGLRSFTFNGRTSTADNYGWVRSLGMGVYGEGANRICINPKEHFFRQRESVLKTRMLRHLPSM